MAKVGWKNVCMPFDHGGLGIQPLLYENQGLLLKWLWWLRNGSQSDFWYDVVSSSLFITS